MMANIKRGDDLTKTEIKLCRFLSLGMSNKDMAEAMDISVRTVESHRAHVAKKIGYSGSKLTVMAHDIVLAELKKHTAPIDNRKQFESEL
jgi:DNA-binding CsgD family transcriptional regulator